MSKIKFRWKRVIIGVALAPVIVFGLLVLVLVWKHDSIVQDLIYTANEDFNGHLDVEGSHISPFANFPYISIDLEGISLYEDKSDSLPPLLSIQDVYLGFDVFTLITGTMEIKSLKLSNGFIKLIQHTDGSFNISNALASKTETEDPGEDFHLNLKSIHLADIDLFKLNEENNVLAETFIHEAQARFKTSHNHVMVSIESHFLLNLIVDGDTTFVRNKHISLDTQLDYTVDEQLLSIEQSELLIEKALFILEGNVDFDDDMNLDLTFTGNKPNFDMFLAFAPSELAPTLERYDNGGKIFFNASVKGKSINGHSPLVVANFGCEEAFFNNTTTNKKVDDLYFKGHFTNGEKRHLSTSEFSLTDFSAKPEAGTFSGNLIVKNFESPEIDMQLVSKFDLHFLSEFFNITDLEELKGNVSLTMNFHDIIDLQNPEKSIERLNESYYTELEVKNLSFKLPGYHLPISQIDIKASMDGHEATIDNFYLRAGDSDITIKASISDLPAIIHHTADPVSANLVIKSNLLDVQQLTSANTSDSTVSEKIKDLSMNLRFNSSARAFTESPNLPVGEFFIEHLYAKLSKYPHTLHDFHADVFVDEENFRIIDFTGMIDESDFRFSGKLKNYDLWFNKEPLGDTNIEFNLTSNLLQLQDVFSYGGENFVPKDYRYEEFKDLKIHGFADLHFNKGLKSSDINIDLLETQLKVHPMRFENFSGNIHYEDEQLTVNNLTGKLGKTEFTANMLYYLGQDTIIRKKKNYFSLNASHLNFDELFNYNPPPTDYIVTPEDHEAGFNIFDLPFTNMAFNFDIKHLKYHRYELDDFFLKARMQRNHYVYIDTMSVGAAGGNVWIKGYLNGSDPDNIYFSPNVKVKNLDLDKLLFKFENFGQDHVVSENLSGQLSGNLSGKVHMHADMVPIIDDSEIKLNLEVVNGSLKNYEAFEALSEYFRDKNLKLVFFDTLRNQLDLNKGLMTISNMEINSTLGYIEVSGKQDMDLNMEYYLRVPMKLITKAGGQKLFGKKREIDSTQIDEIQYRDSTKRVRFLNLKITGTPDDYKISIDKEKK
ncbi:MAG: AsmA-like C-terminal region-containing protein [Cyclobacteriaceae bacterium]|nr:AsmA-like C-terminal region-containing protein [Cyclobacteriaceae bacterium]